MALFRAQTEAKEAMGVTDRALSVLHALLSFHQETALTLPERDPKSESEDNSAGAEVVVFPWNRELSIRTMAWRRRRCAGWRRFVEAGMIIRRDSPNGKTLRQARARRRLKAPSASI
jgi:replication initiation protein RepC